MNVAKQLVLAATALSFAVTAHAQLAPLPAASSSANPAPVTIHADDNKSLTGNTPLDSGTVADPTDISAIASPLDIQRRGLYLRPGTPIQIQFSQPVSSGAQHNGDLVNAKLLNSVRTAAGVTYPQGTPVKVTVLSAAPAGKIQSAGVLSVQVERVGTTGVITNVLEFTGQPGPREIADAAPAKGTEATIPSSSTLSFKVLGPGDTPAPDRPNAPNQPTTQGGNQNRGNQSRNPATSSTPQPSPTSGNTSSAPRATTPH